MLLRGSERFDLQILPSLQFKQYYIRCKDTGKAPSETAPITIIRFIDVIA